MSLSREQMLVEMGISPIWKLRETAQAVEPAESPVEMPIEAAPSVEARPSPPPLDKPASQPPASPPAVALQAANAAVDAMNWPELTRAVAECRACPLCQQRKQAVLGVGDLNPDWLFIGEGPGADEDVQGEPFVGQAGKLLDNMLAALNIARGNKVYIGNAVKCRPPGNRTPEAAEMAACRPYLERQIALLKPKIIVLLGKAAVHSLLHDDKALGTMRGKRFEYAGIPVVVTYHPAYLLRNLPEKAKAWEDLLFARRLLRDQAVPELPF
ncbi:DNA polymerase III [Dechloromonas denitrificans]|uniref:Type-4 uracil-DNA glycosylase n=1 Tax=Dechloromonas denitrificans TaxID=281362 RepID=A0A133XDF4_9RHOO|nr:uracil-DNA glycosylase [Dechloromonas denitrificans]KXB28965.1 DNA polymerase III [Dechloromonas denitrificans]